MKTNRNYFWSQVFVQTLVRNNVKHAVLCPGSRNTPLNLAFANNKEIKTYIVVDERSAGFFATGLARKLNEAVAIVTTSGTAVAELFPSIIEAYYQRIPLLVVTADRPPELLNTGANQTINQKNLFRNSIRNFYDISLPDLTVKKINQMAEFATRAVKESLEWKRGPIQLNFPFKKPLEPFVPTDDIEESLVNKYLHREVHHHGVDKKRGMKRFEILEILKRFKSVQKGLIICGPGNFEDIFPEILDGLSDITGFPVIAEATSQIPFNSEKNNNLIHNFDAVLRNPEFIEKYDPELIIYFGKAATTKSVLRFFKNSNAEKILFNEYQDFEDPSKSAKEVIQISPEHMIKVMLEDSPTRREDNAEWMAKYKELNQSVEKVKTAVLKKADSLFEGRLIIDIVNSIPENSNVFLANSTAVRDASYFGPVVKKNIHVYHNRGASGIDGLISSAAGIAAVSENPTYLIIGDLAFTHDMNGLLSAAKYSPNLKIILIDNIGGGIFEMLPISNLEEGFEEIFKTPVNIDFETAVKAFGLNFEIIKNSTDFKSKLKKSAGIESAAVYYVKTDSKKSAATRNEYWEKSSEKVSEILDAVE